MLKRCLVLVLLAHHAATERPQPAKKPRHLANKVLDIDTTCNKESFDIRIKMERPFKGVVFTKDFARECRAQGTLDKKVTLYLPPNACGVRTSSQNSTSELSEAEDEGLHYSVSVVVQMDKFLQQSSDQEVVVRCWLRPRAMRIRSEAVEDMLWSQVAEITKQEAKKTRTGRAGAAWLPRLAEEQRLWLLEQARVWMELSAAQAEAGPAAPAAVEVGEPTRLLIKSTLPVGIGFRITDCTAHDGLGEASQKLLDDVGCPIDEMIFTKPHIYKHKSKPSEVDFGVNSDPDKRFLRSDPENLYKNIMEYQHATTTFGAFKFPDRSRLHLTCGIELCRGECPVIDCRALQKPQKTKEGLVRRARLDKEAPGVVIERLEVYNSIEVLAPNIELEDEASIRGSRQHAHGDEDDFGRGFSPGDKTICMSPSKMALAFCILGLIFLCALVVAFVSLVRARRKYGHERFHTPLSFYTGSKSVFSASTSSSSGLSGSKLLLTDSPFLDQQSSSSNNWPYNRAF